MTSIDFLALLQHFVRRPMPAATKSARHIYVWQGEVDGLRDVLPQTQFHKFDLHSLCKLLDVTPGSVNLARQKMERAITDSLASEFAQDDVQRILCVTGCDLVARYGVSLGGFLQRANETKMIIFVVPSRDTTYKPRSLPAFLHLQPDATFQYFKSFDDAIVGG